jgi:cystathionine beta-lyase/cystathionine gamma-synthase
MGTVKPGGTRGPSTTAIHTGERLPPATSLTTPIYETSTFVVAAAAEVESYANGTTPGDLYSRYDNPTVVAVERKLAAIDGAEAALVFASGMAATSTALFGLLSAGDQVVCCAAIYGGTYHVLTGLAAKLGITTRFATLEEFRQPARLIGPATRLVWFESPINPTLRCLDVGGVAAACRAAGVLSVADNTFACPVNQPVLAMGVDLSMQSVTKYLNGHSDVTGGVLSGRREIVDRLARTRRLLGGILDPQPAYALARGLKTLGLRVARHNETALAVARALDGHPALAAVYYPGLASHPDHAIAAAQMHGFGGMLCLDLRGGQAAAFRAFDRLRIVQRAASLGGVESLCSLPILTSQHGLDDAALARAGVTRGMMRISIGLEDAGDLIADLQQAIES